MSKRTKETYEIGPATYTVITQKDLTFEIDPEEGPEEVAGLLAIPDATMFVDADYIGMPRLRVLYHEIQHAILIAAGIPLQEHNEVQIDAILEDANL